MVATDDDDRKSSGLSIGAAAQAPVRTGGVDDDDLLTGAEHFFGDYRRGIALADALLGQNRDRLGNEVNRKRELLAAAHHPKRQCMLHRGGLH